jgi:hypothetical protein
MAKVRRGVLVDIGQNKRVGFRLARLGDEVIYSIDPTQRDPEDPDTDEEIVRDEFSFSVEELKRDLGWWAHQKKCIDEERQRIELIQAVAEQLGVKLPTVEEELARLRAEDTEEDGDEDGDDS